MRQKATTQSMQVLPTLKSLNANNDDDPLKNAVGNSDEKVISNIVAFKGKEDSDQDLFEDPGLNEIPDDVVEVQSPANRSASIIDEVPSRRSAEVT